MGYEDAASFRRLFRWKGWPAMLAEQCRSAAHPEGASLRTRPSRRGHMVDDRRALPPRLLRYNLQVSDQLPDIAKLIIVADDGKHVFLVNSAGLTNIAAASLTTATTLSAAVAKNVGAKN